MDLSYGMPVIAVLVVAWVGVRLSVARARRQRELLRRQRRLASQARAATGPETVSARSDMRSGDAPITVINTIQKRAPRPVEKPVTRPKEPQTRR
jgi:hypothetical protein